MVTAWSATCLDKIRPDSAPPTGARGPARLGFSAARGEVEAVQLALRSDAGPVEIESVEAPPVRLGNSEIDLRVRTVGHVLVKEPSHGDGEPGLQPDPLPDFKPGAHEGTAALWIDARVPADAPAGVHESTLTVRLAGGGKVEAPVRLRVYDFALPFPPKLVTAFGLYEKPLRERYGARYDEMLRRYRENLRAHRITHLAFPATDIPPPVVELAADGSLRIDYSAFDAAVAENIRHGMNALDVPLPASYIGKERRLESPWPPEVLERIVGEFARHLAERGWEDISYFFLVDEPGRDAFEVFKGIEEMLRRAAPRIRRRLDMGYGAYGGKAGEVREAEYRKLKGLVEIWVPHIDCVDDEFLAAEQAAGNEVWWYICCSARHPWPNCLVDYPVLDSRVPFWMMFDARVTGYAYWTVNWWAKDPFQDPLSYAKANGDGMLVYPGEDGPIDSIRWEATRDGFEDYEYLALLAERIRAAEAAGTCSSVLDDARRALAEVKRVAASRTEYAKDPAVLLAARDRVAQAIEGLGDGGSKVKMKEKKSHRRRDWA